MVRTLHTARLYVPDNLERGTSVIPDKNQQHYLTSVMRLVTGDVVSLFNGVDGEWQAAIKSAGKRRCSLDVIACTRSQQASPDLWLLFAPVKKVRLDFISQKASEMGASVIWPTRTDFCQVKRVNNDRLAANAIEAAEQTERLDVAKTREFTPLSKVLNKVLADRLLIWCDEASAAKGDLNAVSVFAAHPKPQRAAILIGPEGGFSDKERRILGQRKNCLKVSLGPRILRADTALIAALTCYQSVYGDWPNMT